MAWIALCEQPDFELLSHEISMVPSIPWIMLRLEIAPAGGESVLC